MTENTKRHILIKSIYLMYKELLSVVRIIAFLDLFPGYGLFLREGPGRQQPCRDSKIFPSHDNAVQVKDATIPRGSS